MKQTVLILGASGEIGRAIVKELADGPFQFVLHYHENEDSINELVNSLNEDQFLMAIKADLSQPEHFQFVKSIPFQIDIIIFAQGKAAYGLLTDMKLDILDELYCTHLKSTVAITKFHLNDMVKRQKGNIIIISSIWGEIGASQEVYYSTVKGAQLSFMKALAKEVGQSNIRVNAVSPGLIQTNMNNHLSDGEVQDFLAEVPLGRTGTANDVAKTVAFLCSDDASYIHGQVIRVNGGQLS